MGQREEVNYDAIAAEGSANPTGFSGAELDLQGYLEMKQWARSLYPVVTSMGRSLTLGRKITSS